MIALIGLIIPLALGDSVEIPASRPVIDTNATNVVRIVDQSFFWNVPARGINSAIAIQPGVVVQGLDAAGMPAFHIRGGRSDEIGYTIEGVGVGDMLYGGRAVAVTAEAVEQLQVHGGGSGVGEGGGRAGLIGIQLRTGREDRWGGSLIAETDRFTAMNTKALGGYSYGYSDWTGTIGGPFPGLGRTLRLFGSVQNTFYRDPTVSVRSGWDFSGANCIATDTGYTMSHPSVPKRDTLNLAFPGGNALGGQDNRWIITGTALLDISPLQMRLAGSYSYDRSRTPTVLDNIFNQRRLPLNIEQDGFFTVKFSHEPAGWVSYETSFNYFGKSFVSEDPELLDNLFAYGDPDANAALGYDLSNVGGTIANWPAYSLWGGAFKVNEPGAQIAGFERVKERSIGGGGVVTLKLDEHHVKMGGEYTQYTIRRFAPAGVFNWWHLRNQYADPASLELALMHQPGSDTYGYDAFGRETEGDNTLPYPAFGSLYGTLYSTGPRRPAFGSAFVEDRIELPEITVDLGFRFDYIDPDSKDVRDPFYMYFTGDELLIASQIKRTEMTRQVSPRIGVMFPLGERNTMHARYGKFIQQSELKDSYAGAARMAEIVRRAVSYTFNTDTFGWGLKPTRVTQYEVGVTRQLNDDASFDVTGFYRESRDLVTLTPIFFEYGGQYFTLVNGDFGTSRGLEFAFTLRRTHRVALQVNYTFQDIRGTGSTPTDKAGAWSAGSIVELPQYLRPLDFNQAHRGSILIDYRFGKDDGGEILERLGLNFLVTFNSGHSFTRLDEPQRGPAPADPRYQTPIEPVGASTTPWFFQIDGRIDKSFPLGPLSLDMYIYGINLLGTDNPADVFPRSGDPSGDGWFQTSGGQADALRYGPQYVAMYHAVYNGKNSGNWGPPLQIRFGVRLDY